MSQQVDWHCQMLADRRRVQALGQAVQEAVRPGDVVLDLGAGTGLLSFFACRAGAARVYAIEEGYIIEVARQLAEENGLADRISFIQGHSTRVHLPELVDLVVAEIIGGFGLEEGILASLEDARQRFLKPDGRLLPDRLDLYLVPTEQGFSSRPWLDDLRQEWDLDFAALGRLAAPLIRGLRADPSHFLGQPQRLLSLDLYQASPGGARGEVRVEIARQGLLTGWVGWFSAWQAGKEILSTAPPIQYSSWRNFLFPIGEPVPVAPGSTACLEMRWLDPFWSWRFRLDQPPTERSLSEFCTFPPSAFKPPSEGQRRKEPR